MPQGSPTSELTFSDAYRKAPERRTLTMPFSETYVPSKKDKRRSLANFDWETMEDRQRQAVMNVIHSIPSEHQYVKNDREFGKMIAKLMVNGLDGLTDTEKDRYRQSVKQGILPDGLALKAWENVYRDEAELSEYQHQEWTGWQAAREIGESLFEIGKEALAFGKKAAEVAMPAWSGKEGKKEGADVFRAGAEVGDELLEALGYDSESLHSDPKNFVNPAIPEDRARWEKADTKQRLKMLMATGPGYLDAMFKTVVEMPTKGVLQIVEGRKPEGRESWIQKSLRVTENVLMIAQPVADMSTLLGIDLSKPIGSKGYYEAQQRFYDNPLLYYAIFHGGIAKAKGTYAKAKAKAVADYEAAMAAAPKAKLEAKPEVKPTAAVKIEPAEAPKAAKPPKPVAEAPKPVVLPKAAETGYPAIDLPSRVAHQASRVEVAKQALEQAKIKGKKPEIAEFGESVKIETAKLAEYEGELKTFRAEMTDKAVISHMGRPELIEAITANEKSVYPVLKAVDAARSKYLEGKGFQEASTENLQAYYYRIKQRMRKAGLEKEPPTLSKKPEMDYSTMESSIKSAEAANNWFSEISKLTGLTGIGVKYRAGVSRLPRIVEFGKKTETRMRSEPSRRLDKLMVVGEAKRSIREGHWMEEAHKAGIGALPFWKKWMFPKKRKAWVPGEKLADMIERGEVPEINALLDRIYQEAKDAGIDMGYVGKEGKRYFWRAAKGEILDVLTKDFKALDRLKEMELTKKDKIIRAHLKDRSAYMREAIDHMTKNKSCKSVSDGLKQLRREVIRGMFERKGFEMRRKDQADLPASFWERDAHKLIPRYIHMAARRITEVEQFGLRGEKFYKLIDEISLKGNEAEVLVAQTAMEQWTGVIEQMKGFTGFEKSVIDGFIGFEFLSKIVSGRAAVLQVTQPVISTFSKLGYGRGTKAYWKLVTDATERSWGRQTGAIKRDALLAMTGYTPGGFWGKVTKYGGELSAFHGLNRINLYQAVSTMKIATNDWYRIANNKGKLGWISRKREKWAQDNLALFDIDYKLPKEKALSDHNVFQAGYRFGTEYQLQKIITKDPLIRNDPRWRPWLLFKGFTYKQAILQKDIQIWELKHYNIFPLARLVVGGYVAGESIHWLLDKIKAQLSGEPVYRKEDTILERAINNYAIIGAVGMTSDMMAIENLSDLANNLKFLVTPVIASDVERTYRALGHVLKDWEKYGDGFLVGRRNVHRFFDIWGTYPRELARRIPTPYQKEQRLKWLRGNERSKILDLVLEGNGEAASRRIWLWNKNYEDIPFTLYYDINSKELLKRAEANAVRYIKAAGLADNDEDARKKMKFWRDKVRSAKAAGIPKPGDYEKTGSTDFHWRRMENLIKKAKEHFDNTTSLDRGEK